MSLKESRLAKLASKLLDYTRKDRLKWEETADEKTFRLLVDSGMIQIQERPQEGLFTPSQAAKNPIEYILTVLNENNITAGTFKGETTENGKRILQELYDAAHESALRPDQLLDKIDSEITRLAETSRRG